MSKATKALAAVLLGVAASAVTAEELNGSGSFICAATTAFVCSRQGTCVTGTPEAVNLPTFWHVDPVAKQAKSRLPGGVERVSAITTVTLDSGTLVVQGSDDGFGWSVSIDTQSGRMVLAGGNDTGYLVFGECTTP